MNGRLQGKVAIITGAASGFGAEFARRFAAEGARVVGVDIDEAGGEAVAAEIRAVGGTAGFFRCDITRREEVRACVAHALEVHGGLDCVLNNAGISYPSVKTAEMAEDLYDAVFAVNVKSVHLFSQAALPALEARGGGSILNTASAAALRPRPGGAAYAASKGAVITYTKALAVEVGGANIRVNALAPVVSPTPMVVNQMGFTPAEVEERLTGDIPLGRACDPRDMAACAVFLCSDEAAFVTGAVLTVDGGRTAG